MTPKNYCLIIFSIFIYDIHIHNKIYELKAQVKTKEKECLKDSTTINPIVYHKKVSHQSNLGICYAHTASLVYSSIYEDLFHEKHEISPLLLSLKNATKGYKARPFTKAPFANKLLYFIPIYGLESYLIKKHLFKKQSTIEKLTGGRFNRSFRDIKKLPPCSPKNVEGFIYQLTKARAITEGINKILFYLRKHSTLVSSSDSHKRKKLQKSLDRLNFNKINLQELNRYLETFGYYRKFKNSKISYIKTLYLFFLNRCQEKNHRNENYSFAYKIKKLSLRNHKKEDLIKIIDANLNQKNKTPITISYKIQNLLNEKKNNFSHSSIIYGKSCKNNKLYFLVRNSWGGPSLKQIKINRKNNIKLESTVKNILGGDFWITLEGLRATWTKRSGKIYLTKIKSTKNQLRRKI